MKYETSKYWLCQMSINEDGFYVDSNFHSYEDIFAIRGLPISISVNTFDDGNLNDFIMDIWMKNGKCFRQGVKTIERVKALSTFGLAGPKDSNVLDELYHLFESLRIKSFKSRKDKFDKYIQQYDRYLIQQDPKSKQTISADENGNIYKNEKYFGNWFPSKNDLVPTISDGNQSIRFRKQDSSIFSSERDCYIDTFMDADLTKTILSLINLPLESFTEKL